MADSSSNNNRSTIGPSPRPEPQELELDPAALASCLDRNPALLEAYIKQKWTLEQLDRVRQQISSTRSSSSTGQSTGQSPSLSQSQFPSNAAGAGAMVARLTLPTRSVSTTGVPQRALSERQGMALNIVLIDCCY